MKKTERAVWVPLHKPNEGAHKRAHRGTVVEELAKMRKLHAKQKQQQKRQPITAFKEATIFNALAPDGVIEAMLADTQERRKIGHHLPTIKDVRQYWAAKTFLYSRPNDLWQDNFPLQLEEQTEEGDVIWKMKMGKLNKAALDHIQLPEVVTINEKLLPFDGESPFIRYCPKKDPPLGHWITETTFFAATTDLPFLLNAYPVQQKEGPTMLQFFQHGLKDFPAFTKTSIVVVADAYYIDDSSWTWLQEQGYMYLLSVNPTHFTEVWAIL